MRRTESAAQDQKVRTLRAHLGNCNASTRRATGMRSAFLSEAL